MATIATTSHGSFTNTARRQYITLKAYQNDIFAYTTSLNPNTFQTTGQLTSLATVGTANAGNCPANRILVENGKKLYPGGLVQANSTTFPAPFPGVTTYMVGVYDPVNFLSGYIDPNSATFAPYNTDKPNYVPRGIDPNGNTTIDQGPGVYSLGIGQFGQNVNVGTYISTGGAIAAGTDITAVSSITAGSALGFGGAAFPGTVNVTQQTNKSTAVTADSPVVDITMNGAQLNAHDQISFVLNNSYITADDTLICVHLTTGVGKYVIYGNVTGAGAASITVGNVTASNQSEALVVRVMCIKS